ncbi:MAG: T9SS C-terminal target domain-containing protein [Calditrichaeota bacterium]|nr:MAG: T9SS C-terminal target domain-containing protein [Calditrichota bacterium]
MQKKDKNLISRISKMKNFTKTLIPTLALSFGIFTNCFAEYEERIVAADAGADDEFGTSVSIDGDYAIVGADQNDDNGSNSGSAYIFVRSGTSWTQQAKLTANDASTLDNFGTSVSISGDYAVVGANQNYDGVSNSGSAYIFVRSGTSWTQQAKLTNNDGTTLDNFGISVSINGDYAIIGDDQNDDNGTNSGSAYIFVRSGTSWTQQTKLTANDADAGDQFGWAVSISGNYAAVGAFENSDAGFSSGSAYIFNRNGTSWTQQAKLLASDAAAGSNFGVAISINGDYVIIGANQDDDTAINSGSAYIFNRSGTSWTEQEKLVHNDAQAHDQFGFSVSINGNNAIVGSYLDDDDGLNSGSAYIFNRSGTSWTQQVKLTVDSAVAGDKFGNSVSLSADYAIVGALGNDYAGSNSGSAYFYASDGGENPYTRSFNSYQASDEKIVALDAEAGDTFGKSVSIDGDYAIVGAYYEDEGGSNAGAAYIYYHDGSSWVQQAKLTASDAASDDRFGWAVSISGDYAIVGAYKNDDDGSNSGSAYIFVRNGTSWTEQAKLVASDAGYGDEFGSTVSIDGDYAIVGARKADNTISDTDRGFSYIFFRNGTSWTEQAILSASDGDSYDYFGKSVSIDGDYVIIGADGDDDIASSSGAAYIFVRSGTSWTEQAKFTPSDLGSSDFLGRTVSISGDYAIVGTELHGAGATYRAGAAYIFNRNGTSWSQQTKLTASDIGYKGLFGNSVSIRGDYAIVGAAKQTSPYNFNGSAYIFARSGATWSETKIITADDAAGGDAFGISVCMGEYNSIVGAYGNDDGGEGSGSAYIYSTNAFGSGEISQTVSGDGTVSFNENNQDTGVDMTFSGINTSGTVNLQSILETPTGTLQTGFSPIEQFWGLSMDFATPPSNPPHLLLDISLLLDVLDSPSNAIVHIREPEVTTWSSLSTTFDPFGNTLNALLPLAFLSSPSGPSKTNSINEAKSFEITIGFVDASLAVELDSFQARQIENSINLSWATGSEKDNEGFNLYRKTESTDYVKIGSYKTHTELLGQGNTSVETFYSFTDDSELQNGELYTYLISDVETNGLETSHNEMSQSVLFEFQTQEVKRYELAQNFPNPFNPTTTISYQLAKDTKVSLKIYNILGEFVKELKNDFQHQGSYSVDWDGTNKEGKQVSSGVYFYKISAGNFTKTNKMILLK